jgi:hypothetical protein
MDTGDPIRIINGTCVKWVTIESITRGRASVYWPIAGAYEIDLENGELMSQVIPITGVYSVNCSTGRVVGTRCVVSSEQLPRLESFVPGDLIHLEHEGTSERLRVEAQVVDSLPSEGTFKIYVSPKPGTKQMGRNFRTGWSVTEATLRALRRQAGLMARRPLTRCVNRV